MDKRQKGYEAFIAELQKQWQETEQFQGERLNRMIAKVQAYLEAASDLTQDELALIAEYVKRDLGNYELSRNDDKARSDEAVEESAFMLALKDTAWSWLADVTDRPGSGYPKRKERRSAAAVWRPFLGGNGAFLACLTDRSVGFSLLL